MLGFGIFSRDTYRMTGLENWDFGELLISSCMASPGRKVRFETLISYQRLT